MYNEPKTEGSGLNAAGMPRVRAAPRFFRNANLFIVVVVAAGYLNFAMRCLCGVALPLPLNSVCVRTARTVSVSLLGTWFHSSFLHPLALGMQSRKVSFDRSRS